MTPIETDATLTYAQIRSALYAWNWQRAEDAFREFCDRYRAQVPTWFEDEFVFNGMKLWAENRHAQLLRHFATFLDKPLSKTTPSNWIAAEGEMLTVAAAFIA